MTKKRLVSGDRPTGKLHLGHYVGSIKNRVELQDKYDCYFFVADLHMLTTKPQKENILAIRDNAKDMVLDYLACGIDPEKSTIYLQSAISAIYEINLIFEMLISLNRLTGLPSLKEMARNAHMESESIPFGLIGYPVLMATDIVAPAAELVPVGKDNEAHIEVTRDLVRRFNNYYGETLPEPEIILSHVPTLVGTDGQNKMSKSLNNTIFLSDDEKMVAKRVKSMYTDPNRVHANTPGNVEGNPVFTYLDIFDEDKGVVDGLKERYRAGTVGDVEVKDRLTGVLNEFLEPLRKRREEFAKEKGYVEKVLYEGTMKMNDIANDTLKQIRAAMGLRGYWNKISRVARK